jgi:hypothetical protein
MQVPKPPKPKTSEKQLYYSDNGRVTCGKLHCIGQTAYFTGRARSGQKVVALTAADIAELEAECESCGMEPLLTEKE